MLQSTSTGFIAKMSVGSKQSARAVDGVPHIRIDGFFHSLYFTTGDFPDPLRITPGNREVTEMACRKCHSEITHAIEAHPRNERLSCLQCHGDVGHPLR